MHKKSWTESCIGILTLLWLAIFFDALKSPSHGPSPTPTSPGALPPSSPIHRLQSLSPLIPKPMLRRAPTAITLTPDDITAYEDSRARRLAQQSTTENASTSVSSPQRVQNVGTHSIVDPNDELKPLPGDKARVVRVGEGRAREERIMGR